MDYTVSAPDKFIYSGLNWKSVMGLPLLKGQ
jgi:hypothetical protein